MKKIIAFFMVSFCCSLMVLGLTFFFSRGILTYFDSSRVENSPYYCFEDGYSYSMRNDAYLFNAYTVIESDGSITFHARNCKSSDIEFQLDIYDGNKLIESVYEDDAKGKGYINYSERYTILTFPYKPSMDLSKIKDLHIYYSKIYDFRFTNVVMSECPII